MLHFPEAPLPWIQCHRTVKLVNCKYSEGEYGKLSEHQEQKKIIGVLAIKSLFCDNQPQIIHNIPGFGSFRDQQEFLYTIHTFTSISECSLQWCHTNKLKKSSDLTSWLFLSALWAEREGNLEMMSILRHVIKMRTVRTERSVRSTCINIHFIKKDVEPFASHKDFVKTIFKNDTRQFFFILRVTYHLYWNGEC